MPRSGLTAFMAIFLLMQYITVRGKQSKPRSASMLDRASLDRLVSSLAMRSQGRK